MITFRRTSRTCPEVYQAISGPDEVPVGHVHIRFGFVTVRCPDADGDEIFKTATRGDGALLSHERKQILDAAACMIDCWIRRGDVGPEYVVEDATDGKS